MNPLALGLMALGTALLLAGICSFMKDRKVLGAMLAVLGSAAIAAPFVISCFLAG